ncbi:hypothetical protein NEHOM01_1106 [Nematocida homosporus]|uniref:uncharacterized protein n=1 Tax=Nematocida homosporus TaxID=1912981 RepID=UPI00221EE39F|nr:uncharacterized protein NEHOM01_1106 [Nematocida homosporus]KAI5185856.1 hypothetical protein NEHOM01_1106 [Nematocida homosporus]
MARKKSQRGPKRIIKPKEEKRFSCLECNREATVQCRVDHQRNRGQAVCLACSVTFECTTNRLSQPIDVYSEWVDSIEDSKTTPKESN